MSAATFLFLLLRVAHVLMAAVWLGATAFVTFFLMPAIQETGPAAGPVMGALMRRKLPFFMASLGGLTVVTGFYLYWRFTGGFDPALSATRAAMVFGTGGIAGLLALIIGGAIVSRSTKKMAGLGAQLASMPDGPARLKAAAEMAAARTRAAVAGRIVIALQMLALACMAIGHYV
jgi:uncharacterized membrane protein